MTGADRFHLVRPIAEPARHDASAALAQLRRREIPKSRTDLAEAARHFQLDPRLATAINQALVVGAPLLLTGEPGTGKTQVAYFLQRYFGIALYEFNVRSTSTAKELKYDFDAVAYLRAANLAKEDDPSTRVTFLRPGPLWLAYTDREISVVLIDEIDKAPRDFPNDLLQELDRHRFDHPFDPTKKLQAPDGRPPIVIVTSNAERELPAPFLRRCIHHHLEITRSLVEQIVRSRVGDFPDLDKPALDEAISRFFDLRTLSRLSRTPSTAELLVWLSILSAQNTKVDALRQPLAKLPALNALIKSVDDLKELADQKRS